MSLVRYVLMLAGLTAWIIVQTYLIQLSINAALNYLGRRWSVDPDEFHL